jgi:hypothetical protein
MLPPDRGPLFGTKTDDDDDDGGPIDDERVISDVQLAWTRGMHYSKSSIPHTNILVKYANTHQMSTN